jgi:hypothetical protein
VTDTEDNFSPAVDNGTFIYHINLSKLIAYTMNVTFNISSIGDLTVPDREDIDVDLLSRNAVWTCKDHSDVFMEDVFESYYIEIKLFV